MHCYRVGVFFSELCLFIQLFKPSKTKSTLCIATNLYLSRTKERVIKITFLFFFVQLTIRLHWNTIITNQINEIQRSGKSTKNPSEHKSQIVKRKVQSGDEYITISGAVKNKRIFSEQRTCKCRKNVLIQSMFQDRKPYSKCFISYRIGRKKLCICYQQLNRIKWKKIGISFLSSSKRFINKYFLTNENGAEQEVYQTFLLNCFQMTKS